MIGLDDTLAGTELVCLTEELEVDEAFLTKLAEPE